MFRNDKFTGEEGEYSSVFNALVRQLGLVDAKQFHQDKYSYKNLCQSISEEADKRELIGEEIRSPKYRDPSYYGMKKENYNKLKKEKKAYVGEYKSEFLKEYIENDLPFIQATLY